MPQPVHISAVGSPLIWLAAVGAALVMGVVAAMLCFRRGQTGQVLIRRGLGGTRVARGGILAWPGVHSIDSMNVTVQCLVLDRRGEAALPGREGKPVELRAGFTVGVGPSDADVLAAWQRFGPDGSGDPDRLGEALEPSLAEALADAIARRERGELLALANPDGVKNDLAARLGRSLGDGIVLEDVAIEFFEPVRADQLADRGNGTN